MSKHNRNDRESDEFDAMAEAMASALREALAPITVERLATNAMSNPNVAQFWVAQTEKPCCDRPARDGIITAISTPEYCQQANIDTGTDVDIVQIYCVSEHMGEAIPLALDLEAAKQHVNNVMSAIAAMEARRR